jgi:hypothetical protein
MNNAMESLITVVVLAAVVVPAAARTHPNGSTTASNWQNSGPRNLAAGEPINTMENRCPAAMRLHCTSSHGFADKIPPTPAASVSGAHGPSLLLERGIDAGWLLKSIRAVVDS